MAATTSAVPDRTWRAESTAELPIKNEGYVSGVSWPAVFAGAVVTAALSLILLALGTGIGFSAVSPWANAGASAATISASAIIWLILMQLIASSVGGYLAGRLRTKWVNIHTHEVYFRDTAHGFLVWAVGLVFASAFLASAAGSMVGAAPRASETAAVASGSVQARGILSSDGYFVDTLLRSSSRSSVQDSGSQRIEVGIIFANALREGNMPPADKRYLAEEISATTGISEPEAEKRVDGVFAQAQQAADKARRALAHLMYWTFLALLVGAFCASFAATIGGKQRDRVMVI